MKTFYLAIKLFWKQKWSNLILVFQVIISIIMLAQLFVFVSDYRDSVNAVQDLPIDNTIILSVYEYYNPRFVSQEIASYNWQESVGTVCMDNGICNNVLCNLVVYNDSLIEKYTPPLQEGVWLTEKLSVQELSIPAVVSESMGLEVGDIVELNTTSGDSKHIIVQGIMQSDTQYLYPAESASPTYFSADSIISKEPVVILSDSNLCIEEQNLSGNLFVFLEDETEDVEVLIKQLSKYGEATQMSTLIGNYEENANTQIAGSTIMFIIFFFLAITSILCCNVMQSMRNRTYFTIYYLLGMDWKNGAAIEIYRVIITISITLGVSLLAGKYDLLMLKWMTPAHAKLFYLFVFVYLITMFFVVGIGFLRKLMQTDISASLKSLQQGE